MPRMSFSNTALRSATPGLSRLASAIGGGQDAYNQGYDQETMTQTKLAQSLAQMRQLDSAAALNNEKAASENAGRAVLERRPQLYEEQVAAASGADIPLVQAIRKSLQTGNAPAISDMGPPAEDGSMGARAVDPAVRTKIAGALQQFLPLLTNTNDLKPDDLAQAAKLYRESGLSDAIINGTLDRNKVGGAQAAVAGKPIYNADSTGAVLDQYGGALDTSNPLAGASIALRKAQENAQRANAVQSYAAAENSRASAAETRAGAGSGGKAPNGYRWTPDGNLQVIPGGPADASNKTGAPSEGERKAATLLSRLQFSEQQLENALKDSEKAAKPGVAPSIVRGLPLIGETVANGMTGPERQRVEAAQLDILDAALTLGTGAAYTKEQLQGYAKSFFPQILDDPATIEDKRQRLKNLIDSAKISAGRAPPTQTTPVPPKQRQSGGASGDFVPPASAGRNIVVDF